jgi:Ca2+-binding RTX toxin-like protein
VITGSGFAVRRAPTIAGTIVETRPHALVGAKHHPPGQPAPTNGSDLIIALGANHTIKGLGGNDFLVGGAAGEVLFGGPGADHFIFETLKASPPRHPDTIMDFNHRQGDKIDLYDLRTLAPDDQPLVFIGGQTFAHFHHNHHSVFGMVRYSQGLVEVNVSHHLTNEFEIVVRGAPALHARDFIL